MVNLPIKPIKPLQCYGVYETTLGFFKPGNSGSLWYNDTDFVGNNTQRAKQYKTVDEANEQCIDFIIYNSERRISSDDFHVVNLVTGEVVSQGKQLLQDVYKQACDIVESYDQMSYDDFNNISKAKYKHYRKHKTLRDDIGSYFSEQNQTRKAS